ncbi:ABC transporter ATP-binding protein [Nocardioides dongxiaopingii]|uniref:ABC transporter ATP-binding protein n=1 Tax=Nocardioides dongxiaopingii TaxID=2576036 RepID=UPI0010C76900|nr:ATP-binding cassette domain-containing protein [Nocardioides dongxiaopingii]
MAGTAPAVAAPSLAVAGLTKTFGPVRAVDDLTFEVRPGAVTGFLGPNGAGKTTTLRMLLGLATPMSGSTRVGDRPYAAHPQPARVVGAALEATGFHPGRTGLGHLQVYAPQVGADLDRCHQLLETVGLTAAAGRRVGQYSMGMRQRLGLATALLGDPPCLVLDEPTNGLDPEGIRWLRTLLRGFAAEGRTVLVSSHLLGEVQNTVDDVVVIVRGRLVHASSLADLAALAEPGAYVVSPTADAVADLARREGWSVRAHERGLVVDGVTAGAVGAAAHRDGVELHELTPRGTDLEDVFLRLTASEHDLAGPPGAAR